MQTETTTEDKKVARTAYLQKFGLFLAGGVLNLLYVIIVMIGFEGHVNVFSITINLLLITISHFFSKRVITSKMFFFGYYLGVTLTILFYGAILWMAYLLRGMPK